MGIGLSLDGLVRSGASDRTVSSMKSRVYIETTIPSFYHTLRRDTESLAMMNWTRRWWLELAPQCSLVTSPAVIAELSAVRREYAEATGVACGRRSAGNQAGRGRGQHLHPAARHAQRPGRRRSSSCRSSVHRVDVLLTWNCRHLANPSKMEHIRLVNYELNLPTPLFTTPLNFLGGEDNDAE